MAHIDDSSTLPVTWWKSSASGTQSDCVEFGIVDDQLVAVRDSKRPTGPALLLNREQVAGLVAAVREGTLGA
ncbi:DUF397 domain-containing protein [Streptomyces sp. NBC_00264]|uniref:DUF397 domain-containing protein n=1 Tax=unclassified Streptomyces TaxID=2593676 RepID=UPI00224F7BB9|nr:MULTISPECIES: DUF397 domain-containing protein [unclassified Streptomyces]MCX5161859.1 DUF397 domain-containing protein [Streptomyces sp. NBC_00305]MCX5220382.1 DUF397 domain-containing protein [Streptomyces sp. NBC_00264]